MEPWPLDSTKRSRSAHAGSAGLWRRWRVHSARAISAMPMGMPGWPEFAACTAPMANARRTLAGSAVWLIRILSGNQGWGGQGPALKQTAIIPECGGFSKQCGDNNAGADRHRQVISARRGRIGTAAALTLYNFGETGRPERLFLSEQGDARGKAGLHRTRRDGRSEEH